MSPLNTLTNSAQLINSKLHKMQTENEMKIQKLNSIIANMLIDPINKQIFQNYLDQISNHNFKYIIEILKVTEGLD